MKGSWGRVVLRPRPCKPDDSLNDQPVDRVGAEPSNEVAVDFEVVEREILDVPE